MKFRLRVDLPFEKYEDAKDLLEKIGLKAYKAKSINLGLANEEIAYYEIEECGHDEGKPCTILDRFEVRKK